MPHADAVRYLLLSVESPRLHRLALRLRHLSHPQTLALSLPDDADLLLLFADLYRATGRLCVRLSLQSGPQSHVPSPLMIQYALTPPPVNHRLNSLQPTQPVLPDARQNLENQNLYPDADVLDSLDQNSLYLIPMQTRNRHPGRLAAQLAINSLIQRMSHGSRRSHSATYR